MSNAATQITRRLANPVLGKNLVIQQHNRMIDIFFGEEGFHQSEWSRYIAIKGKLEYVKGKKLGPTVMAYVANNLGG